MAAPIDVVDAMAVELTAALDATEVGFLIADYSGRSLTRLSRASTATADHDQVPISGSVPGQALRTQQVQVLPGAGGEARVAVPVSDRGEAVGVLELTLPVTPDADTLEYLAAAGHALALAVISVRRYTDVFEWGQRSVPLSLPAEIQHGLLPGSFTCEAAQFALSGWLEPAETVAGDTFDYIVDRDTLHLSMTDAMGHELDSALLATVLVNSLRNARRGGDSLVDQAQRANAELARHSSGEQFVTGQLLRVDLTGASPMIVNAGHPAPFLCRDGNVERVKLTAEPPFGMFPNTNYTAQPLDLQPGDRLLLVTDGMLERSAAGLDVIVALTASRHLHPREAVQHLTQAARDASGGRLLDDATVLCLDWYGAPPFGEQ